MSFPLALSDFWDLINIAPSGDWVLTDNRSFARGAGRLLSSGSRGPRLWTAEQAIPAAPNAEAGRVAALLDRAQRGTFLAYPKHRRYPAADPDGSVLGASTPVVQGVPSDRHQIRISGLPAGYVLTGGDYLSVLTSGGLRSFHRVFDATVTADGFGITPVFDIEPARALGVAQFDAVTLIKAAAVFAIRPDGRSAGSVGVVNTSGMSFDMIEAP